jgi:DNA-directed RNA polymerase specialized sigma24 family protein
MTEPADSPSPSGDEAALFELYHGPLVRIVTASVNASSHTVEDACAFAWVQLLRYQPGRRHLMGWLVRVATREVWRLTGEEWRMGSDGQAIEGLAARALAGEERIGWTQGSIDLATLRPEERRLLLLAAAGYSYAEIATITGHSRRAVERRLKRARCRLRGEAPAREATTPPAAARRPQAAAG